MGLHKPFDRDFFLVNGNVAAAGSGSKNLAKGQFAIVDTTNPLPTGARVVTDFAGAPANATYEIRVGKHPVTNTRTAQTSKPYSSIPWKISQVRDIQVSAPKTATQKFDEFIIGYDGINDNTALTLEEGVASSISINLSGAPINYLGGKASSNDYNNYSFKINFAKEVGQTNQEMVQKAVTEIKNRKFGDGNKITDLVDIKIVDSTVEGLVGTSYDFATLTVTDSGDSNALALVQAQYPAYKVEVTDRIGQETTYTILKPSSVSLSDYTTSLASKIKGCDDCGAGYSALAAGVVYAVTIEDDGADLSTTVDNIAGFVSGTVVRKGNVDGKGLYTVVVSSILTPAQIATYVGGSAPQNTATFQLVGDVVSVCANSTTTSTAWVVAQTCTASKESYTIQLADNECGNSRLTELQAYYPSLVIEEGLATGVATQTITLTGSSGDASVIINGTTYTTAYDTSLTITAAAFVTDHATDILADAGVTVTSSGAVITLTGTTEGFPTVTAVAGGLTETISAVDYVTTATTGGCQRVYSTTVVTNILCEDCDPIFSGIFESEAPTSFDFTEWKKVETTFDEDAKMGILIKGKPFIIDPEEALKDDVPFYETSVRIKIAGGGLEDVNYTLPSVQFPFAVRKKSFASDRDHLGANLRWKELQSMVFFDGEIYQPHNNFRKAVLGQESVLDPRKQYVDYAITIGDTSYSQSFAGRKDTATTYHIWAEVGRHQNIEAIINKVAAKAGIASVQAYGNI